MKTTSLKLIAPAIFSGFSPLPLLLSMLGTLSMILNIFAAAILAVESASKYGAALAALKPPKRTHRNTVRRAPGLKSLENAFGSGQMNIKAKQ